MIALASVDLPEPFGPMRAWIWPSSIVRSTPLRISFSPARTWRLRISSSDIGLLGISEAWLRAGLHDRERGDALGHGGVATTRELDELRERGALQRADDAHLDSHPEQLGRARAGRVALVRAGDLAGRRCREALHRRDRPFESEHHLVHRDRLRGTREAVAAVRAAAR